MNDIMGSEIDPSTSNPFIVKALDKLGSKIKDINVTTQNDLDRTIRQGIEGGDSIGDLKKRVTHVMDKKGYRAEMIARTESSKAYDQGAPGS